MIEKEYFFILSWEKDYARDRTSDYQYANGMDR